MESLVAYDTMVEGLASSKSDELISNRCEEHAAVLIKHLFKSATASVLIFTGTLSRSAYCRREIINAAREFLARGGMLQVIIQKAPAAEELANHDFIRTLDNDCSDGEEPARFAVFAGNDDVRQQQNHFIVADNVAYRFEKNSDTHEAFASFNDGEIGRNLAELFAALQAKSLRIIPRIA